MRLVALLLISALASCGGQPALANAPHPDPGAVAGIAAAAAAAMTLADPNAATRKPEKKQEEEEKRAVEVKETVPSGVLDRLDESAGSGSGSAVKPPPAISPPATKRSGAPPKLPSPREAVDPDRGSPDRDR